MEGLAMTIARLSDNVFPSVPSFFNRFFEGDLMDWNNMNFSATNTTLPAVNVRENDNEFLIDVAAPGMSKENFKIDYENGKLTISSEKKDEKKEKEEERFTRREFSYMSFQRSFTVPENVVEGERINARYDNGILSITLPKRDEVKPKPARNIKIS
jgi:HSP20 family protein